MEGGVMEPNIPR